jgi:NAD(P)-dependent dehydrogenase (short-subunit alcohol dehydrogenase family)
MQDIRGRIAVVTGAASGIGFALADRFGREGAKVVLADIELPTLNEARDRLRGAGVEALAVETDVSDWESVQRLADDVFERFGTMHLLCNNAGVGGTGVAVGGVWQRDLRDWQWVLGVNLWGVIHGVHAFLPRMIEAGEEGHVMNTASAAGLSAGTSVYGVSKHAVVALSEALRMQLKTAATKIGVSVLCPGFVRTNIVTSVRNRPPYLATPELSESDLIRRDEAVKNLMSAGIEPAVVADAAVAAMRENRFYVLPMKPDFRGRFVEAILQRAASIAEDASG